MDSSVCSDALLDSNILLTGSPLIRASITDRVEPKACRSLFFPGCSLLNFASDLAFSAYDFLHDAGAVDGISLICCGKILRFEPDAERIVTAFEDDFASSLVSHGVREIVCACPNCLSTISKLLESHGLADSVTVSALPDVLVAHGAAQLMATKALPEGRIAVHDSCPDRASGVFARSTRALFAEDILLEMEHNRKSSRCCGSLARAAGHEQTAISNAKNRESEALQAGADMIVTACMSCAMWLSRNVSIPVYHYLELLFEKRIDWTKAPDHLSFRFLFSDAPSSTRSFMSPDDTGHGK